MNKRQIDEPPDMANVVDALVESVTGITESVRERGADLSEAERAQAQTLISKLIEIISAPDFAGLIRRGDPSWEEARKAVEAWAWALLFELQDDRAVLVK
jgi:hypothetical protein